MDIFDPCSTTRTLLLILSSLCECFLFVFKNLLLIWAGSNNGNVAFGTVDRGREFGAGNEHGRVDSGSIDMLLG